MRKAFAATVEDLAADDPRVLLLTGDLGFGVLDGFARRFPARFLNLGVAEQNMVGVATGLAAAGFVPFVYSIVPFATLRPYEFIRNGPVLHHLPVRIVGVGAGTVYGHLGPTHYGLEDVGALRLLPGLTVVVPADPEQVRRAIRETWELPGPVYYRLGRDDPTVVDGLGGRFGPGGIAMVREGSDVLMLAAGAVAVEAVAAADELAGHGVRCAVVVVSRFSPPPALADLLAGYPTVVTVETHYPTGGLGSLVAEAVADHGLGVRVVRLGVGPEMDRVVASRRYLSAHHGLDRAGLVSAVLKALSVGGTP